MFDVLRPRQVALLKAHRSGRSLTTRSSARAYSEARDAGIRGRGDFRRSASTGRAAARTSRRIRSPPHRPDDVRITTRFIDRYPFALLFGTLHETGHGALRAGRQPGLQSHASSKAARRSACTSRRAGSGRTSSGGRGRSGSTSTRRSSGDFRRSWRGARSISSTARSTRCSRRSFAWKPTRPPTTCT